jgi:hypothetical protein
MYEIRKEKRNPEKLQALLPRMAEPLLTEAASIPLAEMFALAAILELRSVPGWASARQSFRERARPSGSCADGTLLCASLSFRAAKIVAAKRIAYFRCSSI